MQELTFTNFAGDSFAIGYGKPYLLQNLIGLSDAPVDLLSTRGYHQDGQSGGGQYFQARSVSFSVVVVGEDMREVYAHRRRLISFLNPKDEFSVIYKNEHLSVKFRCRVSLAPAFESAQARAGITPKTCAVTLVCDNPYLFDVEETVAQMSVDIPNMVFPLVFNPDMVLSTFTNKEVILNNLGDVPAPVRIQFLGVSVNPVVTNATTGEQIKVFKEILADEIMEITTGYGDKRVEIIKPDGTRENAFQYIDLSSSFFQLAVGENTITYDEDSGADSAQVYIYYSNLYVGV